jgi:hypothetical protein
VGCFDYNNTVVGDPDGLKPGNHFDYPVFNGFYSGVRWLQLSSSEGLITAVINQRGDAPGYIQIFAPKAQPSNLLGRVAVPFPAAGVSFLHAISAIGNKFGSPQSMGPMGLPAIAQGEYKSRISLHFAKFPLRSRQSSIQNITDQRDQSQFTGDDDIVVIFG